MPEWRQQFARFSAACGALSVAAGTALSAYAAHGLAASDQGRAYSAAIMLGVHGLGLLSLARWGADWLISLVRLGLLLGLWLFAGSLLAALFWQWRPALAPVGGSLLILAWLLAAVAAIRGPVIEES